MNINNAGQNQRRNFLTKMISSAAAFSLATLVSPFKAGAETLTTPAVSTDSSSKWLMNLSAKHKMVFDVLKNNDGVFMVGLGNYLNGYNTDGTPDKDINAVVVFRHIMVICAINDDMWEKYKFGEVFKLNDPKTGEFAKNNVYWKDNLVADLANFTIHRMQKRGVLFGVCAKGLDSVHEHIAMVYKLSKSDITKEISANMLPDIEIIPSGLWGVDRAQEQGCNYCYTG